MLPLEECVKAFICRKLWGDNDKPAEAGGRILAAPSSAVTAGMHGVSERAL